MANARIPEPLGSYDVAHEHGSTPDPVGTRYHRPIRVADADNANKDSKKQATQPASPQATRTVYLHFYLPVTASYTAVDLYEWIRGPEDSEHPPGLGRWDDANVELKPYYDTKSGAAAFKKSLLDTGAVVVYLGHSALDDKNKRSLGLTPQGLDKAEIMPETVMSLLKQSKAALVILASCASSTLVGKLTGGPALVVTDSGPNLKTWSNDWGQALPAFLLMLIGYEVPGSQPVSRKGGRHGTISEALDAANEAFKNQKTTDHFVLANGNGSTVIFPEK
jgi:hypothetical protein